MSQERRNCGQAEPQRRGGILEPLEVRTADGIFQQAFVQASLIRKKPAFCGFNRV